MMASPTISRNRRDEMAADQTTGISVANSRTAPSHPTHPRWSNAGTPVRHSVSADTRISAYSPQPPRRTASDKVSRQWQRHQLHRSTARECASSPQRTERRRDATLTSTTAAGREERGSLKSTHWKPAMKQVLMGVRATDAITNTDRLKDRKLTFWHGVKVKKASKDRITYAENDVLRKKCRAGITIVEQQAREAVEREQAAADPDSLVLPTESKASSPENVRLVFSLFHSVPEVVGLDSIYKTQLFHELRIERYAAGSVVFRQWEQQAAICAVLEGSVQLKSKHSGVTFQAGTLGIGEVLGSITPKASLLTATCSEVTTLLCFDADRFAAVINDLASVERIAKKEFLKCSPVFSTLSDDALNTLETLFTTVTLEDNQVLCKEGSRIDHVYVVKRGFVRLLKAFIPDEVGSRSSRPTSRGRRTSMNSTTSSGAEPAQSYEQTTSEKASSMVEAVETRIRLKHFDLGEIGPKDVLGENGVLQQDERSSLIQTLSAATATFPSSYTEQDPQSQPPQEGDMVDDGGGSDQENAGDRDTSLPTDAAEGAISSPATGFRPRKPAFIVSATASGGRAEVYVANAYALKRLQTDEFLLCWKTAERLHQARARAWSAGALAQQLRRQMEWETFKCEILSQI